MVGVILILVPTSSQFNNYAIGDLGALISAEIYRTKTHTLAFPQYHASRGERIQMHTKALVDLF